MRTFGLIALAAFAGIAGVYGYSRASSGLAPLATAQNCVIKGNISIDTGERIYHVPGQHYYAVTKISPEYGERWFCSEAEARAAGWRAAKS